MTKRVPVVGRPARDRSVRPSTRWETRDGSELPRKLCRRSRCDLALGFVGKERVEMVVLPELRLCRRGALEGRMATPNPLPLSDGRGCCGCPAGAGAARRASFVGDGARRRASCKRGSRGGRPAAQVALMKARDGLVAPMVGGTWCARPVSAVAHPGRRSCKDGLPHSSRSAL